MSQFYRKYNPNVKPHCNVSHRSVALDNLLEGGGW